MAVKKQIKHPVVSTFTPFFAVLINVLFTNNVNNLWRRPNQLVRKGGLPIFENLSGNVEKAG